MLERYSLFSLSFDWNCTSFGDVYDVYELWPRQPDAPYPHVATVPKDVRAAQCSKPHDIILIEVQLNDFKIESLSSLIKIKFWSL